MLKKKAIELNVNEQVEFHKNVTYRLVPVAFIDYYTSALGSQLDYVLID